MKPATSSGPPSRLIGLGANLPKDAVYPFCYIDGHGQPVTEAKRYVLHFEASDLPPFRALWSLTMYDAEGFSGRQPAGPLRDRRPGRPGVRPGRIAVRPRPARDVSSGLSLTPPSVTPTLCQWHPSGLPRVDDVSPAARGLRRGW
jgi:hypothetical protein